MASAAGARYFAFKQQEVFEMTYHLLLVDDNVGGGNAMQHYEQNTTNAGSTHRTSSPESRLNQ